MTMQRRDHWYLYINVTTSPEPHVTRLQVTLRYQTYRFQYASSFH